MFIYLRRLAVASIIAALFLAVGVSAAPKLRSSLGLFNTVGFAGVVNPADVCNGWHPDVCPVAFTDRDFQDRILWVQEETGAESVSYYALPVSCGPGAVGCLEWTPTFIAFKRGERVLETGAREVIQGVEAVRIAGLQRFGAKQSDIFLKWYPGYEARHPSQGNPIGAAWPDHPYAKRGWKMFKPSAQDGPQFAVGSTFQLDQRRWVKWRAQTVPGSGPFGMGGKVEDAWEEVTLR